MIMSLILAATTQLVGTLYITNDYCNLPAGMTVGVNMQIENSGKIYAGVSDGELWLGQKDSGGFYLTRPYHYSGREGMWWLRFSSVTKRGARARGYMSVFWTNGAACVTTWEGKLQRRY